MGKVLLLFFCQNLFVAVQEERGPRKRTEKKLWRPIEEEPDRRLTERERYHLWVARPVSSTELLLLTLSRLLAHPALLALPPALRSNAVRAVLPAAFLLLSSTNNTRLLTIVSSGQLEKETREYSHAI